MRVTALAVSGGLQAASFLLLARYFGPGEFGVFAQVMGVGVLLGAVSGFGFSTRLLRIEAEPDRDRLVAVMVRVRVISAALSVATSLVLFAAIHPDSVDVVILAALFTLSELLIETSQATFSGLRRQGLASTLLVVQRAIALAFIAGGIAVQALPTLFILGILLCLLPIVAVLVQCRHHPLRYPLRRLIRESRHYWISTMAASIGQMDVVVVGFVGGPKASGLYGAANRVTSPLNLITNALLNVLVPDLSVIEPAARIHLFGRLNRYALGLAAMLALLSPVVAALVVRVLGDDFNSAEAIIAGFVIATAISGVSRTCQAFLFAMGEAQSVAHAVMCGAVIGLVLIFLLGTFFGIIGYSLAPVGTQLIIVIWLQMACRRVSATAH